MKETVIRLNRFIAESGIASRRKAEEYILQGRVSVNNEIITNLGFKVDPVKHTIAIDNEKISPKKYIYFLLNKPKGIITSVSDEKKRKTVIDLIRTNERIFPVGRLDYDTTGVLLLTNNGEFSNLLTHPKNKIPKEYEVWLDKPLYADDKAKLQKGLILDGRKSFFTKVSHDNSSKKHIFVTAIEGRNHFVKKMLGLLGYKVVKLNRKRFAGIKADIPPGSYRKLSSAEVEGILKQYAK